MNEAYNMDCLDAMRQMPDKAFDLAIVDPPYGGGAGSQFVQVERERERETAARRGSLLYRCLYDRIVIKRKVQAAV